MNTNLLLAHTEAQHSGFVESAGHLFENAGFAFAIWLLILVVSTYTLTYVLKIRQNKILLALAVIHLVYGVYLFNKSATIGALVITVGFVLTLTTVLIGIQADTSPKNNKEEDKDE